jgi:hypothetical protein
MFHGHLDYFQKPPLGSNWPNIKLGYHGTRNAHNYWFILFYHVWGPAWVDIHKSSIWLRARLRLTSHYTWGSVTILHDFGRVLGRPWTLSFGLSQFHGHGSWLVCEVALKHSHWWKTHSWSKFASHYGWGTTEYVNAWWMWSLHGFLHGIQWIMFHGHLDHFQKPLLGGRSNTTLGNLPWIFYAWHSMSIC